MPRSPVSLAAKILLPIGFVLPILLVSLPAFLTHHSERRLEHSQQWVTHTQEVQRTLEGLLNTMVDAETGQRGFLLTQRPSYLEPYENARARVEEQLSELRTSTADNKAQQQRLAEVEPIIRERLALVDQTVAQARRGDRDGAIAVVLSDRGKVAMDRIRGLLRAMSEEEQTLLRQRQHAAAEAANRTTYTLIEIVLAGVVCSALAFFLIGRALRAAPLLPEENGEHGAAHA